MMYTINFLSHVKRQRYEFILKCWDFEPVNRPRFTNIVSALSISLEAMAGYLDIGAFGETAAETNSIECRESSEPRVEEQALCQASSEAVPVPNESTL